MKVQKDLYDAGDFTKVKVNRIKNREEAYFNLLKPLCDTATNTFLGRTPDIVTNNGEREIKRISKFTLMQKHNDFEEEITDVALQSSITGSGFLCLYADSGDTFPHYRSLDPLYTNVVYDCSVAMKRLFAYTIYYDASANLGVKGAYVCICYTKDKMYAFYTPNISIPTKMAFNVYPYQLFLINGSELSYSAPHGFTDIPIYEFMNNKDCRSDCKPALSVMELYGKL
jgi:SPP1 family phage portal protein